MNLDLIYTIAIGNSKSQMSISVVQISLYMLSIDMSSPSQGILIAAVMSILISLVAVFALQYYNSSAATVDGINRYVRTLDDKKRTFRQVIVIAHATSLIILTFLYLISLGVARYYIYTGPMSILLLLIVIMIHDESITKKYDDLRSQTWVFDYNRTPAVKSIKKGKDNSINMFDEYNNLILNESEEPTDLDNIFKAIPPGTKVIKSEMLKPNFELIDFKEVFKYTAVGVAKVLYLKYDNKQDEKKFDLYIDILSKFKGVYDVEAKLIECSYISIQINKHKVETYIESSDYVKKFVNSKEAKVGMISIQLSETISSLPVDKFLQKQGKRVKEYELKKVKDSLYVSENMGTDNYIETDISYLQKYMSLNIEEYYAKEEVIEEKEEIVTFHSIKEKIEAKKHRQKKEENIIVKTLYQLNIKGELIYLFLEDIATMAELDELIVTNFINKDIMDVLDKLKKAGRS